jgi:hypothetical protein
MASLVSFAPDRMASSSPCTCKPPGFSGRVRSGRLSAITTGTTVWWCLDNAQVPPSSTRTPAAPPAISASRLLPESTGSRLLVRR